MYCLPLACLLLTLTLTPPSHAAIPPPNPPSHPTSSSPALATLLPAISSALRDLSAAQSDDVSYLTVAKRNVRFMLSALVSPLQLLDWSHWSTEPLAPVEYSHSHESAAGGGGGGGEEWLARSGEDEFSMYGGDPSQSFRAMVNAQKQPAVSHTPHRSHTTAPQPSFIHYPALTPSRLPPTTLNTTTTNPTIDAPLDTCSNNGVQVRFTRYRNGALETSTLCWCPADYSAATCTTRRPYRCTTQLASDTTAACTATRATPNPTLYNSHSDRLPPTHLNADSASPFYTYEPVLSGGVAPCMVVDSERPLTMNFSCSFVDAWSGANVVRSEGFDAVTLADRVRRGYRLNDTLPVMMSYSVKNVNDEGNITFAVSGSVGMSVMLRLHNTAHPSQYQQTIHQLTPQQLTTTPPPTALTLLANTSHLDRNLRRGGRLLLQLRWHDINGGTITAGTGLPWQLVVEDGEWELPGAVQRVWLTRWQMAGVMLLVVLVVGLCVWRWYQRRQTAAMQALVAEQRGKQQSWFIASH